MTKNILSKEWIAENGEKLKQIYSYAVENKKNISSNKEVLGILEVIDPKNANGDYATRLSKVLQLFRVKFRSALQKKLEK